MSILCSQFIFSTRAKLKAALRFCYGTTVAKIMNAMRVDMYLVYDGLRVAIGHCRLIVSSHCHVKTRSYEKSFSSFLICSSPADVNAHQFFTSVEKNTSRAMGPHLLLI